MAYESKIERGIIMEEMREIVGIIKKLAEEKDFRKLRTRLEEIYPMDIAEAFDELSADECIIPFRLLKKDKAADVFSYMSPQRQKDIVGAIHENLLGYIIDELNFDDLIDFLEDMPANFVKRVIAAVPPEERELVNRFLNYKDDSAGSIMTIEYVDLKKHMTVSEAIERIKKVGMDKETVYTCYVLDNTRQLEGIISLRKLVLSEGDTLIADIMTKDVIRFKTDDDQEEIAGVFKKFDFMALPVVDAENRMIGIITIDDIVDVIEQENTEDIQKMAAITPSDEGYLQTPPLILARRRFPWLLVLMVSAVLTGGIIGHYEDILSAVVVLAVSIPLLMDTGGNAGSQSATLVIRGLALGEIQIRDWPKVIWKELRVSLVVGLGLAGVNFLRMAVFGLIFDGISMALLITVNATLIVTVIIAKVVGCSLPILAKSRGLDPAIMASPLITTIVDALALFIYFGIASLLVLS